MILEVILWICVFLFGATGLITILDLAGIREIRSSFMRKALFTSLILELAIVSVAAYSTFLNKEAQNINKEQMYLYYIVVKIPSNPVIFTHQMALVRNSDGLLEKGFLVGLDTKNENTSLKDWSSNAIAVDSFSFEWFTEHLKSDYWSKATIRFADDDWSRFEGEGVSGSLSNPKTREFTISGHRFYP